MSSTASFYIEGNSVFHRIDPRAKLSLLAAIFMAAWLFDDPVYIAVPLGLAVIALVISGGLPNVKRIWFIIVALFTFGLIIWPSFTPARGPTLIETSLFTLTKYEFLFALGRSERIGAFIFGGLVLVTTTSNEEIVAALRKIGFPYAFCFAIGTALRMFPTILSATGSVKQAQEARGHDLSSRNPIKRIRGFVPLLIPIFMTSMRKVEEQSRALESRGFDPKGKRTYYRELRFGIFDWVVAITGLSSLPIIVYLSFVGVGSL